MCEVAYYGVRCQRVQNYKKMREIQKENLFFFFVSHVIIRIFAAI
jgi:hypothetical protein